MTRPIDADALHEIRFTDIFNENVRHSKSKLYMLGWNDAIDAIIYDTPTVDAVPVIRCKDCKHCDWDIIDIPYGLTRHIVWCCFRFKENGENVEVSPNDFCSKAERKEE